MITHTLTIWPGWKFLSFSFNGGWHPYHISPQESHTPVCGWRPSTSYAVRRGNNISPSDICPDCYQIATRDDTK